MQIKAVYSHLNGKEWLMVRQPLVWQDVQAVVSCIDASKHKVKLSEEKRMHGKMLFSPSSLNEAFKNELEKKNWKHSRVDYWVTDDADIIRKTLTMSRNEQKTAIEAAKKKPIPSYNQTDFVKNRVALEVQFGKYSFIAYDMFVKHLAFYVGDTIDCGIEILPMKEMQEEMSSGPGYFESALYDLVRQGRGVPAVPLVVVGISP